MVYTSSGHYHLHRRKRIHPKHEKYPHSNKWKKLLDGIIYPVSLFGPILVIPQVLKLWVEKDASSISLITFIMLLFPAILWVVYGMAHKEKPIIVSNYAWIIIYIAVIIATILYG